MVARNLYNLGYDVSVVMTAKPEEMRGDAGVNARILRNLSVPVKLVEGESGLSEVRKLLDGADFVVDALLGTGIAKPVEGLYLGLVELINTAPGTVVSVDIPSGLNSGTGRLIGPCVSADLTVTFAFPKLAHILPPACEYVGELYVVDISIPPEVSQALAPRRYILTLGDVVSLYPERKVTHHKYTFGHVALVGGSAGKTGAIAMSAEAVLRAGGGLSTVIVPSSLNVVFETKLTEVMSVPVPDHGKGYLGIEVIDDVRRIVEGGKFSAVVLGPGLGGNPDGYEFARELVRDCTKPMVIDADGINALAGSVELLRMRQSDTVLTPHIGEFSRLTGLEKEEILGFPHRVARDFALEWGVTVVLKSGRTVVATPDGKVYINLIGNPGMATAGTGDVLSGVIGALLGMGMDAESASKLGVFLHSLSADLAVERLPQESLKAWDLIEYLPEAVKVVKSRKPPAKGRFVTHIREIVGV